MIVSENRKHKSTIGRAYSIRFSNRGLSAVAPGLAAMAAVDFIASQRINLRNEEPRRRREVRMSKMNQRHPAGGMPAPQWRPNS